MSGALPKRQEGISLFVGLVFLVILSLLGLTAAQVASVEERMGASARDRSIAFQAAEAALRDAENDIQCIKADGTAIPAANLRSTGCISGMTGADASCTGGLCCRLASSGLVCIEPASPVHQAFSMTGSPSIQFGRYTQSTSLPGLPRQPRYLIEPFKKDSADYYRITARGYGVNSSTQVTLQEVFKPL